MNQTYRLLAICAGAFASITAVDFRPAVAQERPDTFRLGAIVVTATRLPTAQDAVPAAVTVLDGETLRERGVHFVADALRGVPGAAVARNGSTGGLTSLFLRGGQSNYVQVLIDGVQVNEPGGAFDFGQLTTDRIERIEIVRGPASVLYGSDAVSGVVHVITRDGSGAPRVTASLSAGSAEHVGPRADGRYATTAWDAAATGGGARASYSLGISGYDTDGAYAFNNAYDNRTFNTHLRLSSPERSDATITMRYTRGTFHFPTDGAGALVDENQFARTRSFAIGLDAGHFITPTFEARLLVGVHDSERITDDRPDGAADTLGVFASLNRSDTRAASVDVRANVHVGAATVLTLGGVAERQTGQTEFRSESEFGPFESDTDDQRSNRAGYTQLVVTPAPRLTLTAGGRAEDNEQFGTFLTYRVGANYRLGAGTLVRAATGTAFREPTFFENFAEGFTRGNPDLEPERSRSWEAGIEQSLWNGRASLGVTYFDQRFTNLIQYTGQPPGPDDANYFNVGEASSSGLELTARVGGHGGLDVAAGYTYLDTDVADEGYGTDRAFSEGRRLLRRPRHSASFDAGQVFNARGRLGIAIRYVGERDDLDFSDPVEFAGIRVALPAFSTVDLSAGYELVRGAGALTNITLTAALRNAFNERYEEIRNFPSPGRSVMVGLQAMLGG